MPEGVYIIGSGGHAKVVISVLLAAGEQQVAGLLDEDSKRWGARVLGAPVIGSMERLKDLARFQALVAIGDNERRRRVAGQLSRAEWVTVIHPRAYVHASAVIGPGSVICAGAVVQPDAVIGAHTIVNTGASVDHDCRLGDFAQLGPGARLAGSVRLGAGALVGMGAMVMPGRSVGDWSVVGAGAVVTRDLPAGVTAVGVPARARQK